MNQKQIRRRWSKAAFGMEEKWKLRGELKRAMFRNPMKRNPEMPTTLSSGPYSKGVLA
ncbi:hypothetical protein [Roseibacillus persicicus]|uniref:hypothetical protein n=1 Tax=Roseibacillus persicicus TaxID=454148 RepID=UPI00280D08B2|nr:hypothetical protein [Roseibacillus persicicus]MDQ8188837.1 hypothetical protein [Roseibacillus persicicus]